jgi:hypothetical protein
VSLCIYCSGFLEGSKNQFGSRSENIQDREVTKSPGGKWDCCTRCGIRAHKIDLCREMRKRSRLVSLSGIIYINTMSPRRHAEPPIENRAMERKMREIRARLDAMEAKKRRAPDVGDFSDAKNEEVEVEEVVAEDVVEERLLKLVVKFGARPNIDIPMYEGNLDIEELLEWI